MEMVVNIGMGRSGKCWSQNPWKLWKNVSEKFPLSGSSSSSRNVLPMENWEEQRWFSHKAALTEELEEAPEESVEPGRDLCRGLKPAWSSSLKAATPQTLPSRSPLASRRSRSRVWERDQESPSPE